MSELSINAKAYLVVDTFIDTLVKARTLKTAIELGIVDHLAERRTTSLDILCHTSGCDKRGMIVLTGLLETSGVIQNIYGDISFTQKFQEILPYMDLLQTKLNFSGLLLTDFAENFTLMISKPEEFQQKASIFQLFNYDYALEYSHLSYTRTRLWMQLTGLLSRYEAIAFLEVVKLTGSETIIDVGGNSGVFAQQICKMYPNAKVTVFDLPLVCQIGLDTVLGSDESDRISFLPGDLRTDSLPLGHQICLFKSMLHDWDDQNVRNFLAKAHSSLPDGGRIVIYERIAIEGLKNKWRFGDLPLLMFFRSYRDPKFYSSCLEDIGMKSVSLQRIELDSEFIIIEGYKSHGI